MLWKKDESKEMAKKIEEQDKAIKAAEAKHDRLDDLIDRLKERLDVEVELARKRADIELLQERIKNPIAELRERMSQDAFKKSMEMAATNLSKDVPDTIPSLRGRPRK